MDVFGSTLECESNKMIDGFVATIKTLQEDIAKITDWMEIQENKFLALDKKSDEIVIKINNIETSANYLIAGIITISNLDSRLSKIEKRMPLSIDKTFVLERHTDTWATQHWIFKNSPCAQNGKSRKTNKWLEHNFHHMT
ncbi:Hypothetical protein CINCED_3A015320 [Cinara cedri]|uniref:Uncharacterized protein n=1 Tax=Cinara cedri TaxID=506608 RepID=A0A5E4N988_9HEMI|nr:Hypothetical protein CINCED_3A015320 [Cinara cedri]